MPRINLGFDSSNNSVLRTMSDRMDLGPNGPKAIMQVGMTVAMVLVVVVVGFSGAWSGIGRNGPMSFSPLVIVGLWVNRIVRSARSAKETVDAGWRD